MAVMKRDVNLGLLLLIIAAILMFSGFTVYYQTSFKNLSKTYQNQLNDLGKVTKDLEAKRGALNETSVQLQLKQQKEESLSKKYVETESQRSQLETDKKKLEVDLAGTKASLASTSAQLANTQSQLDQRLVELSQKITQIDNLNAKIANLNNQIDSLNTKVSCLKSKADADEGSC